MKDSTGAAVGTWAIILICFTGGYFLGNQKSSPQKIKIEESTTNHIGCFSRGSDDTFYLLRNGEVVMVMQVQHSPTLDNTVVWTYSDSDVRIGFSSLDAWNKLHNTPDGKE